MKSLQKHSLVCLLVHKKYQISNIIIRFVYLLHQSGTQYYPLALLLFHKNMSNNNTPSSSPYHPTSSKDHTYDLMISVPYLDSNHDHLFIIIIQSNGLLYELKHHTVE